MNLPYLLNVVGVDRTSCFMAVLSLRVESLFAAHGWCFETVLQSSFIRCDRILVVAAKRERPYITQYSWRLHYFGVD
jgi:hypothetical protein